MTAESDARAVLAQYPPRYHPLRLVAMLNAGGFSGSSLWQVEAATGRCCLRRWPSGTPPQRVAWVNALLEYAAAHGFSLAPIPCRTAEGGALVVHGEAVWDLQSWLPGTADYARAPSPARLTAAVQALADFHAAVADLPPRATAESVSPGLRLRLAQTERLISGGLDELAVAVDPRICAAFCGQARRILELARAAAPPVLGELRSAAACVVPLQPCIRDIWHDHVLFEGDRVTGLVDFAAADWDSVATDLARLLGSLVADDPQGWQTGLDAYAAAGRLSPDERRLVEVFDRSGVLLSGVNWVDWLYRQRRRFADEDGVRRRIEAIVSRLARLAGETAILA